jgi:hypothetical protein
MTVPAGTWWLNATATLESSSPNPVTVLGSVTCRIRSNSTTLDQATWRLSGLPDGIGVAGVALTTVREEAGSWSANLTCYNSMQNNLIAIRDVTLSAQLVSTSTSPLVKSAGGGASIPHGTAFHTVDSLSLPKGRWWIVAKTRLANASTAGSSDITCRVKLSSVDQDQTRLGLATWPTVGSEGEVGLQVAHAFGSAGTAKLECKASRDSTASEAQIVALKVGKLTRKAFGGSSSSSGTGTPRVITGYKAASTTVPLTSFTPVATLSLPAGAWLVTAKAQLDDSSATKVECALSADESSTGTFSYGGAGSGSAGIYIQTAASANSAFTSMLECRAAASGATLKFLRITAVKVSSLTFM